MKTRGLPYMALMAAMASMMKASAAVGINMPLATAYQELGGLRSRGKGRGTSWPSTNGSARVRRAAEKRRNVARHRAHCKG